MRTRTKTEAIKRIVEAYSPLRDPSSDPNRFMTRYGFIWANGQLERCMRNTDVADDEWTERIFEDLLMVEFSIPPNSAGPLSNLKMEDGVAVIELRENGQPMPTSYRPAGPPKPRRKTLLFQICERCETVHHFNTPCP